MVRHMIRMIRTALISNGSNRSKAATLLFWIHSTFLLLLSDVAWQVGSSVPEMPKGPTGGKKLDILATLLDQFGKIA
jgi:hypothetical protein